MYFDLESNIIQDDKPDSTSDKFRLEKSRTLDVQGEILAMTQAKNFFYFVTFTDIYKWDRTNDDSLNQAYTLQPEGKSSTEMFKDQTTRIWSDHSGTHVLIKHNNHIFYFNGRKNKVKEIQKLRGFDVTALCFDDRMMNENQTGTILFSDFYNNIFQMQLEVQETKNDMKVNVMI